MAKVVSFGAKTAIDMAFYRFAADCYSARLGVVFKGGCLLRHILRVYGHKESRGTKDIDFDVYFDSYIEMEENWQNILKFGRLRKDSKVNAVLYNGGVDCDVLVLDDIDPAVYTVYTGEF